MLRARYSTAASRSPPVTCKATLASPSANPISTSCSNSGGAADTGAAVGATPVDIEVALGVETGSCGAAEAAAAGAGLRMATGGPPVRLA